MGAELNCKTQPAPANFHVSRRKGISVPGVPTTRPAAYYSRAEAPEVLVRILLVRIVTAPNILYVPAGELSGRGLGIYRLGSCLISLGEEPGFPAMFTSSYLPDEFARFMRSRSARSQKVDPHTRSGELTSQSGIITGRLTDWADALETTPSELVAAIDRAGVEPLVDTGVSKDGEEHPRPTRPELRCIAMTEAHVGRVSAELLHLAPAQSSR